MRTIPLIDKSGLPPAEYAALADELASQRTLADVLAAGRVATPPREVAEIVTPDEYTHDVIVRLSGERWLVYDTT